MASNDPFSNLVSEAQSFLKELSGNNTREWFAAHKARYEAELKTPATLLQSQIGDTMGRRLNRPLNTKLFRPHRDVRFSKDKTPYHVHLHMLWSLPRAEHQAPGLFFGISPDYVRAGGGVMAFDKSVLTRWRSKIDKGLGAEMQAALDAVAVEGLLPAEPDLKRLPAPYPSDHVHADLLRRKGLAVWMDLSQTDYVRPLVALERIFTQLRPVLTCLERVL